VSKGVLRDSAQFIDLNVNLLQIKIYYCKAIHSNTTMFAIKNYFLSHLLNIHHIEICFRELQTNELYLL
jgi:hypothetical protein